MASSRIFVDSSPRPPLSQRVPVAAQDFAHPKAAVPNGAERRERFFFGSDSRAVAALILE